VILKAQPGKPIPKKTAPGWRAGRAFGSPIPQAELVLRLLPGDTLNIATGNSDISQFPVAEVRKLVHGDPISLPGMQEAENR
jgi:hypothetical protein